MSTLAYIIIFSLIGGVASLFLASLLLLNKKVAAKFAAYAMPFAAGALLAAVFLDLLIEGVEVGSAETIFMAALVGIILFFMAERFIRWFHHHHQHGKGEPAIPLLIIGDTVHNILDGVAIAAAFMVSIPTGIVTTLAVAAHEIPQEVGEFGALLNKGMPRGKVLFFNILSSLAATVAAIVTYFIGQSASMPLGVIFGLSAGFLLYVAMSDIIPSIHESNDKKRLLDWQPFLLIAGVVAVGLATWLAHGLA
ncbi:MAG: ZIP family metal transporter [Candidatus Microsaccharimonas sp.]